MKKQRKHYTPEEKVATVDTNHLGTAASESIRFNSCIPASRTSSLACLRPLQLVPPQPALRQLRGPFQEHRRNERRLHNVIVSL